MIHAVIHCHVAVIRQQLSSKGLPKKSISSLQGLYQRTVYSVVHLQHEVQIPKSTLYTYSPGLPEFLEEEFVFLLRGWLWQHTSSVVLALVDRLTLGHGFAVVDFVALSWQHHLVVIGTGCGTYKADECLSVRDAQ